MEIPGDVGLRWRCRGRLGLGLVPFVPKKIGIDSLRFMHGSMTERSEPKLHKN
jgi:hypothetical protein